jgi:4-amino-4-deoxy-L-arabinose transferase-like glycosyltransferase
MNRDADFLRAGRDGALEVRRDVAWLVGLCLFALATGIGLRDPWPADEPRFALIARDMVATGNWLIPQIGGDVYPDKPPLFFWIVGAFYWLTGSLRAAILLPGFLGGLGAVLLIYDLARRLWSRAVGFSAALMLLASVQFVWQARQGQIDATLCFLTTLSLYGLLRHLLLGPAWRWYFVGWAAAGLGVITKGVGVLPLLVLIPYAVARSRGWANIARPQGSRWWLGPVAMLAAILVWLAPMLIAAQGDAQLAAYRDEILFGQTVQRYTDAWHHREPFWYFLLEVIPGMWLPLIALTPWVWRGWRAAWQARDARVLLPLAWVLLVLLFFSASTGKRGVYILPALPTFVLACSPFVPGLLDRRGPRNMLYGLALAASALTLAAAAYLLIDGGQRMKLLEAYEIDAVGPLLAMGLGGALICIVARPRRAFVAYGGVLLCVLLVISFWVNPAINEVRSGAAFMRRVQALAHADRELGMLAYKEQYLLYLERPAVNFGHSRWREFQQEAADAAAWLAQAPTARTLLVDERAQRLCFSRATVKSVGVANRTQWLLVTGQPDAECVARGRLSAARTYAPTVRE